MVDRRFVRTTIGLAVAAVMIASGASAQTIDKRTYFTFSGPITLPGVTLPAGQYLFRLADPNGDRKIVRVSSADGRKAYALLFTFARDRAVVTDKPEVAFLETAPGVAPAVKAWWAPGERTGYEFIYPKHQARLLAAGTVEPVLTTREETQKPEETNTADLVRIAPGGVESPAPAEPQVSSGPVQVGVMAAAELPTTGTPLPLIGLIGLFATAGAGVLRLRRLG